MLIADTFHTECVIEVEIAVSVVQMTTTTTKLPGVEHATKPGMDGGGRRQIRNLLVRQLIIKFTNCLL